MNFTPVSYRTRLKNLSIQHPWITQHHVKPKPGHIDLIVRLLDLCEVAMGTPSPSFSVFQVRYLLNNMRITAIPTQGAECDLIALRKAIWTSQTLLDTFEPLKIRLFIFNGR